MVKIEILKAGLSLGDYGDCIADYERGYICDIFSEIADNHTSIYYSDIKAFVIENIDAFENAINEFGWQGDFYNMGQLAEYSQIQSDLYMHEDDIIRLFAYDYIFYNLGITEINNEKDAALDDLFSSYDSSTKLEIIADDLKELFEEA